MYKVPARYKRSINDGLKRFLPLIHNLQAKGKSSSEDDARILLNDILGDVLGYDKYNELKTEMRERNHRCDYVVKLSDGPNAKKADRFDFIVEAKAAHVELNEGHINQTLSYCLSLNADYFVLTNSVKWQLFKVKRSRASNEANLIHEIDLGSSTHEDSLSDEFYLFSKASYLNGDWGHVAEHVKATSIDDVAAVILSDKIIRAISRELMSLHGVKISPEAMKDIVENQIIKSQVDSIDKKLIKKLNMKSEKTSRKISHEAPMEDISPNTQENTPTEMDKVVTDYQRTGTEG